MQAILRWYGYIIRDNEGKNSKGLNNFDYFLVFTYAIISLFNAISSIGTMKLFVSKENMINIQENDSFILEYVPVVKTVFLILVNIIILLRLNIKLYIKEKTLENSAILDMYCTNQNNYVSKVTISALEKRINLIKYVYIIDVVIILMNIYYKTSIETSLSLIVILPIIITWWNNLIDIAENKFMAEPQVLFVMQREVVEKITKGRRKK